METETQITDGRKIVGLLHFIGNLLSGWLLGMMLVAGYLLLKNDIDPEVKKTCYHILNFNFSFWIYFAIAWVLMFLLIGFIIIPFVGLAWIILLVIGFIKHLAGDDYEYPLTIEFLK